MRSRPTLALLAALVAVTAALTPIVAGAASAPAPAPAPAPTSAATEDAYFAFAAEHAQPTSASTQRSSGGATFAASDRGLAQQRDACHVGLYDDTTYEVSKLDVAGYGIAYHCEARVWDIAVGTRDTWGLGSFEGYAITIDRDGSAATGCQGYETVVVVILEGGVPAGVVFATPSCNDAGWVVTGNASGFFDGSSVMDVEFGGAAIAHDQDFRWALILASNSGTRDRAPDDGWRTMRVPCGIGATTFAKVAARQVYGAYDRMVGGDFDGDGIDDLFFYGRGSADDGLLEGSAAGLQAVTYRPPVNGNYDGIVAGDFNGDGADDIFFYGEGARPDGYLLATPGSFALTPVTGSVQVTRVYDGLVAGDFNGDGLDDIFFYGAGSNPDGLLRGTPLGLRAVSGSVQVSRSYDEVQSGDFDGDGFDDIFFYGRGSAPEGLLVGGPTWLHATTPGIANGVYDEMRPGDFNGDGLDDLFFYARGTTCEGLLRGRSSGPMIGVRTPGVDGTYDDWAGGDYDGDGKDDLYFFGRGSRPDGQLLGR